MSDAITTGKLRSLHRSLAARPGQPVLVADLVREVWGDAAPAVPMPALRQLIKRLRRSIPDEIVTEPSGYRLVVRTPGPCQLPADLPDFVGREFELARLSSSDSSTVAITGPPGMGKTALAVRLAHRLRDRFPDGQLYVNMRGFASGPPVTAEQALGRFLRAQGVAQSAIPADLDAQVALYRSKLVGKRMLVVLDNAVQGQVEQLLPGQPGCRAIVTSRNDLPDQLRLDVLSDEDADELLVRMKVGGGPADRAELVRLCAHLPLALRIAGANVAHGHLQDYLTDLRGADRLDVLEIEGDAAVRAAFDLSYRALPDDAKRLFRLLGLHPGADVGVDAARALMGADPVASLDLLVGAGLVQDVGDRYQLHDLIRLFAASMADPSDRERLNGLFAWYVRSTINSVALVVPEAEFLLRFESDVAGIDFATREDAAAWLEEEHANLVAVVLVAPSPFPQHLADAMRSYLHAGWFQSEKMSVFRAGLRAARTAGDPAGQSAALTGLGQSAWILSAYREALDHYTEAARLAQSDAATAAALIGSGISHLELGELDRAAECFTRSLKLRRRTGNLRLVSSCLVNLGIVHGSRGELREAVAYFQEAKGVIERAGLVNNLATCVDNLGVAYFELGEFDLALEMALQAVELHTASESRRELANALGGLARIHAERGDFAAGREAADRCLEVAGEIGYPKSEVVGLVALALLDQDRAGDHAAAAVEVGERIGYGPGVITASILLAQARGSVEMIDDVLVTIRESDNLMDHSRALLARARITGDVDVAREALMMAELRGQAKVAADTREFLRGSAG